jgi:hypothetical protein
MVPHQAVGNTDPDLQATFDDPEHLTKVPGSWEELEQREADDSLHLLQQLLISTDAASRGRGSCYWYPKKKEHKETQETNHQSLQCRR